MDFSGFSADCHQEPNPEGIVRLWKILAKSFTAEYPAKADVTTGEITVNPVSRLPANFVPAEYVLPAKTIFFNDMLSGEIGYMSCEHVIEFESAGFSNEIFKELFNDINAGAVYVAELADSKLCVIGTSKKGLVISSAGQSGKNAGDKRGRKYKAQNAGYKWPVLPLSTAAKYNFLLRTFGYGPFYRYNSGFYLSLPLTINNTYPIKLTQSDGTQVNLTSVAIANADGEEAMTVRAAVAWQIGDVILITKQESATIGIPPYRSNSMYSGWALATVVDIYKEGEIDIYIVSKSLTSFSNQFHLVFSKPPTFYSNLSAASVPANGFTGAFAFTNGGAILPFVAGDLVHLYYKAGAGIAIVRVNGVFVSQVGATINVTITLVNHSLPIIEPAPTLGWILCKDTGSAVA